MKQRIFFKVWSPPLRLLGLATVMAMGCQLSSNVNDDMEDLLEKETADAGELASAESQEDDYPSEEAYLADLDSAPEHESEAEFVEAEAMLAAQESASASDAGRGDRGGYNWIRNPVGGFREGSVVVMRGPRGARTRVTLRSIYSCEKNVGSSSHRIRVPIGLVIFSNGDMTHAVLGSAVYLDGKPFGFVKPERRFVFGRWLIYRSRCIGDWSYNRPPSTSTGDDGYTDGELAGTGIGSGVGTAAVLGAGAWAVYRYLQARAAAAQTALVDAAQAAKQRFRDGSIDLAIQVGNDVLEVVLEQGAYFVRDPGSFTTNPQVSPIDPEQIVRLADEPSLSEHRPTYRFAHLATTAVRSDLERRAGRYQCSKECEKLGSWMLSQVGCPCALNYW